MENNSQEKNGQTQQSDNSYTKYYYFGRHNFWLPLSIVAIIVTGFLVFAGTTFHRRALAVKRFNGGFRRGELIGDQISSKGMVHAGRFGHIILGAVTAINGDKIIIKQNDQDVVINAASDTSIFKNGNISKLSDIKTGDVIIVHGKPGSNGQVAARSIVIN